MIQVKIWKWLKLLNAFPFIKKTLVNHVYIRIWSSWLTFTVLHGMRTNFTISQFSWFLLRSEYAIQVKIWKWLKLLNSVAFIKKILVNQVYIRIWSSWLTFTVLQWVKTNFKISQLSRFLSMFEYAIKVKIWKWLKPLNSVPFIKKTLVNQVYIRIWSSWLTFTVLKWVKTNFKISQLSRFLPMFEFAIKVKIWKWLKLLNSVPFIKKTLVNQVYIRIWSFWLTFTAFQWMKKNSKISEFSGFLLRSGSVIQVKIWKWLKLFNGKPFIKETIHKENTCKSCLQSNLIILTDFHCFTVNEDKHQNYSIWRFLLRSENAIQVKIWKWLKLFNGKPFIKETIHKENTCKSCLQSNLIILTDFHCFTVNEDKHQNYSIWRFLLRSGNAIQVKIWKCLKLLNSVPFIKKTLVNHVYIRIWSSSLTFTVLQWMKKNSKISEFSLFLLRFEYTIKVKIWK